MIRQDAIRLAATLLLLSAWAGCSREPSAFESSGSPAAREIREIELADYQKRFVSRVHRVITSVYKTPIPDIKMLDSGCDTSGKQVLHFSRLIRGEMVGISPEDWFPDPAAQAYCQEGKCTLIRMDGLDLKFPDETFDVVLSANVLEHVSDPDRYLQELHRVLKKGGVAILEFYPVWSGPRGHHIHEDMVKAWGGERYVNDGSIIPDWGHLRCTQEEMQALLKDKMRADVLDQVLTFIYSKQPNFNGINRLPWSRIKGALESTFSSVRIKTWPCDGVNASLKPQDGKEDYEVGGAWILAGKERDLSTLPKSVY